MPAIAEDDTLVVVVVFTVEPHQQEPLIAGVVAQVERWIRDCPGFVSSTFHASEDGTRVVNYAQWRRREDWEAFTKHPEQAALMAHIRSVGPEAMDGRGYRVVRSLEAG
jgi:C-6 monooxygenase